MKLMKLLFGREANDNGVSRELDEHQRLLEQQERRLARILHLRRERELYDRRRPRA